MVELDRETLWREICKEVVGSALLPWKPFVDGWRTANTAIAEEGSTSTKIKKLVDSIKDHLDLSRGLSDDDYQLLDRLGLSRFTNSIREALEAESRRTLIRSKYLRNIPKAEEKKQELICKVLLVASDAQTMTGMLCSGPVRVQQTCVPLLILVLGIALIITAMAQHKSLSLYHLHIIYDTINFTT